MAALEADSKRVGTQGEELDFALLLDGLAAEREQGITIDVAYRFFSTDTRKYIVADTPGHEQYTRNMVTGASTADCAVILLDARKGVLTQTRRHSYLVWLLGLHHVAVAVNKMDLVDYSEERFHEIERQYGAFAERLGLEEFTLIPVSALRGDNVVDRSEAMPWYDGPDADGVPRGGGGRPGADAGRAVPAAGAVGQPAELGLPRLRGHVAAGQIAPGDRVVVLPAGNRDDRRARRRLRRRPRARRRRAGRDADARRRDRHQPRRHDRRRRRAGAGQPAVRGDRRLDGRGAAPARPHVPDARRDDHGARDGGADPLQARRRHARADRGDAARPERDRRRQVELGQPVAFDPYVDNRDTGGFILIDRITNHTVGAGLLRRALPRSENVRLQELVVDRDARAGLKAQRPFVVWLTGRPGAGKSSIANALEARLFAAGRHTVLLDGANLRRGLSKDLSFSDADRAENNRRAGEVARLMTDAGLIVLAAFVSPFRADRETARSLFDEGEFIEVFVDLPAELAAERDTTGLYAKAGTPGVLNLTGVDSTYEDPEEPDIHLDMTTLDVEAAADRVAALLSERGLLS